MIDEGASDGALRSPFHTQGECNMQRSSRYD